MAKIQLWNVLLVILSFAFAQASGYAESPDSANPLEVGIGIATIAPMGEFRRNVGGWSFKESFHDKGALAFNLLVHMRKSGVFRLRFDCFAGTFQRDSASKSLYWLRSISVGPEAGLSKGSVRPYINAAYGRISFSTGDWVSKEDKKQIHKSIHGANEWIYGVGVRIPLGARKRWSIDTGLRCHQGGVASYMRDGGFLRDQDGSVNITPTRGRTSFMAFVLSAQYWPGGGE